MKEQHEILAGEKARLTVELQESTQRFVNIQARIEELKADNEDRFVWQPVSIGGRGFEKISSLKSWPRCWAFPSYAKLFDFCRRGNKFRRRL